jgi:hypothetical protein
MMPYYAVVEKQVKTSALGAAAYRADVMISGGDWTCLSKGEASELAQQHSMTSGSGKNASDGWKMHSVLVAGLEGPLEDEQFIFVHEEYKDGVCLAEYPDILDRMLRPMPQCQGQVVT